MLTKKITFQLSDSRNHILVYEDQMNQFGIAESTRRGAIRCDPAKSGQALEWAKQQEWVFVGEPNRDGFYTVEKKSAENTPAAETDTVAENELAK